MYRDVALVAGVLHRVAAVVLQGPQGQRDRQEQLGQRVRLGPPQIPEQLAQLVHQELPVQLE